MSGLNHLDGFSITGLDHLYQSIRDILSTPIGSRVERRDYGSNLYELIDRPVNNQTIIEIIAATADALRKWEPRFKVTKIEVPQIKVGHVTVNLFGIYILDGREISMEGIVI